MNAKDELLIVTNKMKETKMNKEITLFEKFKAADRIFSLIVSEAKKKPNRLGENIRVACICYKGDLDYKRIYSTDTNNTNLLCVFIKIIDMIYSIVSKKEAESFWRKIRDKDLTHVRSLVIGSISTSHEMTEGEKKRKESIEQAELEIYNKIDEFFYKTVP